jgi:hypothetical protein
MIGRFSLGAIFGWWALILIGAAIAGAQLLGGNKMVHRALWVIAALVAVAGAVNEWRK